ncbi:hypothetical protein FB567DRAFT_321934 [Paraphoma chrysanthemicola]|uniref:Uncharacterized protein n=1 Tax=Paraphoma chrysanthemicola TaxID=798071 RepID=A0A8K0RB81_9PLEO|nr:hypothetical protein FB567DRAFT_321934 [Paraphoma chrysanthemicola]
MYTRLAVLVFIVLNLSPIAPVHFTSPHSHFTTPLRPHNSPRLTVISHSALSIHADCPTDKPQRRNHNSNQPRCHRHTNMDLNLLYTIDTRGYADDLEPHNPRYVDAPKILTVRSTSPTSATIATSSSSTTSMATPSSPMSSLSTSALTTPSAPEVSLLNNDEIMILFDIVMLLVLVVVVLVLGWAVFVW